MEQLVTPTISKLRQRHPQEEGLVCRLVPLWWLVPSGSDLEDDVEWENIENEQKRGCVIRMDTVYVACWVDDIAGSLLDNHSLPQHETLRH